MRVTLAASVAVAAILRAGLGFAGRRARRLAAS